MELNNETKVIRIKSLQVISGLTMRQCYDLLEKHDYNMKLAMEELNARGSY